MLTREAVEAREERLRLAIRELPEDVKLDYFTMAKARLKDPDTYAALNYISVAGLHHLYLHRWVRGLFNLGVFGLGLSLMFLAPLLNVMNPVGCFALGSTIILAIALVELPALFRSQLIVQDFNNDVTEHLLGEMGLRATAQTGKPVSAKEPLDAFENRSVSDEKNPYRNF